MPQMSTTTEVFSRSLCAFRSLSDNRQKKHVCLMCERVVLLSGRDVRLPNRHWRQLLLGAIAHRDICAATLVLRWCKVGQASTTWSNRLHLGSVWIPCAKSSNPCQHFEDRLHPCTSLGRVLLPPFLDRKPFHECVSPSGQSRWFSNGRRCCTTQICRLRVQRVLPSVLSLLHQFHGRDGIYGRTAASHTA